MSYPGNETLAEEIRERILNTFRQTLGLVESGDLREAQLGCDFVLRLDPLFEPARTLHERLQAGGEVAVGDLKEAVGAGKAGAPSTAPTAPPASPPTSRTEVPEELDPVLPPAAPAEPADPVPEAPVVLDLDEGPSALDSALDLSSLETEPPASTPSPSSEPASPPSPAPAASDATDSGTGPIAELDDESEQRVASLLEEGQAAFEKAEYQSAIDAWSRIFLIDIDHVEANRRIDLARKLKAEVERKLEETFHEAVTHVEGGRLDEARKGFGAVLEIMPGHLAAQEYLDRLDAPDFVPPPPPPPMEAPPEDAAELEGFEGESEFSDSMLGEIDEVTAAGGVRPAVGGVGRASKPPRSPRQTFRLVGAAGLVLFAVGGWLLYQNWNTFFPNASDAAAPVQLDPITRAKRTYAEAGAAIAIAQLRRLSPGHPQYAEAQALVAQWEASLDASQPKDEAPDPEALAARDELVGAAESAYERREFLLAQELFERAASQAALDDASEEMLEEARDELVPIQAEIAMFREGEWEMALRNLWRIKEGGSETPDVLRLMVDSYFNLGVRDLQRSDAEAAKANFEEAIELAGDSAEITRLMEFAEAYQNRSEDLLYRIFVKYLPFR